MIFEEIVESEVVIVKILLFYFIKIIWKSMVKEKFLVSVKIVENSINK